MLRRAIASFRSIVQLLTAGGWTSLVLGALLLALGLRWSHRELVLVGVAMLGVLLVGLLWMLRRTSLQGNRVIEPAVVEEEVEAQAVVRVHNFSNRASPQVTALDHINGRPVAVSLPSLKADENGRTAFPVPTEKRGVYTLGPLTIAHTDPFRLVRAGSVIGGQASYRVWPRTELVPPLPTGRVRDMEGAATPRTAGSGVTFHNLREYVPGDDLRQIHWRSTARAGTLMVRQNILTSEPRMVVFLDCQESSYDGQDRFDDACRIAASLVRAGIHATNPVELMVSSGETITIDSSGQGQRAAFDLLSAVRLDFADEGLVRLARLTERRHAATSIAVITGSVSTGHADLVRAMQPRYASFTAVQVAAPGSVDVLPLAAGVVVTPHLEDFVLQWRSRIEL